MLLAGLKLQMEAVKIILPRVLKPPNVVLKCVLAENVIQETKCSTSILWVDPPNHLALLEIMCFLPAVFTFTKRSLT